MESHSPISVRTAVSSFEIVDIERGQFSEVKPFAWQTDTAIAKNSWCYTEHNNFKKAKDILCDLVDIVSKNGCLVKIQFFYPVAVYQFTGADHPVFQKFFCRCRLAEQIMVITLGRFQMYDSALSKWNAANMGPCRNVLGELSEEDFSNHY